jgi:hypothetical protein
MRHEATQLLDGAIGVGRPNDAHREGDSVDVSLEMHIDKKF